MNAIKNNFKKLPPILILILISLCLRAGMAYSLGDTLDGSQQIRTFDQHSYDLLAHSLLAGRGYTFEQNWYPFTPAHTPTAHWSFLYPIFLAGIYAVMGFHPLAARLVQVIISSILATYLLYRLGRWLAGEVVGLVTAGLGMIYSYFILYDASLMTESFFIMGILIMFILSLKILGLWNKDNIKQADPAQTERSYTDENFSFKKQISLWVLLGIDLGITALLRQTILLWVPFLFAYLIFFRVNGKLKETGSTQNRYKIPKLKTQFFGTLVSLFIFSLFIIPFTIRNYFVYGAFLPLNSNAGYALYSSNYPAHGTHFDQDYAAPLPEEMKPWDETQQNSALIPIVPELPHRILNEAQLNTQLTRLGLEYIIANPKRFLLLSLNRVGIFFSFGFLADSSLANNLVRTISTGVYLPLFLIGIWLSRHHARRYLLFYLFALIFSLIHIVSWASIRYRLPIDAVFMPFAGMGVVYIVRCIPEQWIPGFLKKQSQDKIVTGINN